MTMQMKNTTSYTSVSQKTLYYLARELQQALRDFEEQRQALLARLHLPVDYPFLSQKGAYGHA